MGLVVDAFDIAKSSQADFVNFYTLGQPISLLALLVLIFGWVSFIIKNGYNYRIAPIVGKRAGIVFPVWRARLRYILGGVGIIKEGYEQVVKTL